MVRATEAAAYSEFSFVATHSGTIILYTASETPDTAFLHHFATRRGVMFPGLQ
jgi:hypothetical protein